MTFGENMKRARLARGLTQQQLADRLGISQAAVGQFEKYMVAPKKETIKKIADALAVDMSELDEDYAIKLGSGTIIMDDDGNYYTIPDGEAIPADLSTPSPRQRVDAAMDKLNDTGQNVAADRVEEMTDHPKYKK